MNSLEEVIIEEIKTKGPITFARFMEMALYYPELGYYTRPGVKIGAAGDFYTSPDVHPAFGQALARQFFEMWEQLGRPVRWELAEYGAGKGRLASQILKFLREHYPRAADGLTYHIIEISPYFLEMQREELKNLNLSPVKIRWTKNAGELTGRLTGCLFSNELVDSFPVHRVRRTEKGLKEIYINYQQNSFAEEEGPLSTPLLAAYFEEEGVLLEPGQAAEVNLAAKDWLREAEGCLEKGFLLTIDYGGTAREIYAPFRHQGTLRCFSRHQLCASPYRDIGRRDITASVNFSALMRWGKEYGLANLGLLPQGKFLMNLGILESIRGAPADYSFDADKLMATLAIKKLIMPEGMGEAFKVLIQSKGFSEIPRLRGLK
ncbi:MAG: SAM-dependent methyltransferase [Bacillota bacterium]